MIIAIEGTDGCGKHTQSKLLQEAIKNLGQECKLISFPDYDSPACAPVKMYLSGEFGDSSSLDAYQVNTLYAVDRLCTMQKYKDYIAGGGNIVFDRYTQSSMLHQSALIGDVEERDRFLDYINHYEFEVLKLPRPDIVIFLDVPVEVSKKLADARGVYKSGMKKDIYEEDVNHLKRAYEAGKYVAKKFGWKIIDCTENGEIKSIEEIHNLILTSIGLNAKIDTVER